MRLRASTITYTIRMNPEESLRAIRKHYEEQIRIYEERQQRLRTSLEEQARQIHLLIEEKKQDKLKIRELERSLSILVAQFVEPGTDISPLINAVGEAAHDDQDQDHAHAEEHLDHHGEEEHHVNANEDQMQEQVGEEEQPADIRLDDLKTEDSGEEMYHLENAYLNHESRRP